MSKDKKSKYKTSYYHSNNDEYITSKEYEPEEIRVRKYDPEIDGYVIEKIVINQKLDWENTEELYMNTLEIGEE